jgi:hypothetical protein
LTIVPAEAGAVQLMARLRGGVTTKPFAFAGVQIATNAVTLALDQLTFTSSLALLVGCGKLELRMSRQKCPSRTPS